MPQFEITYKVFDNDNWTQSSGPSHYTMVVEALHQGAATQMVKNMNGGARCNVLSCRYLGG